MSRPVTIHPLDFSPIVSHLTAATPCLLLDTARPGPQQRYSYLFTGPQRELLAWQQEEIPELLAELDRCRGQAWLAGFLCYEAAYALEPRLSALTFRKPRTKLPLGWFGVFEQPAVFDHYRGVWDHLPQPAPEQAASPEATEPSDAMVAARLDFGEYEQQLAAIKRYIEQGDTYQVNFTFNHTLSSPLPPLALYRQLRRVQPTPYCAFLRHGFGHVLSFSPEQFFAVSQRDIQVKPMKGTARRAMSAEQDAAAAAALAADPKNRAENIMIVDLLRNDLGRVCATGSIRVSNLCAVETHPTLHQMTSTITGRLAPDIGFADIFRGLFPCGSVTGAPKIRTMEIIRELEAGPRGVYCGALGFISPQGDASFSVPIRTLQKPASQPAWNYRVGSGVIWDSQPKTEWEECRDKCAFLQPRPVFELVETMLLSRGRIQRLQDHLQRMAGSADYFGFPWNARAIRDCLARIRRACPQEGRFRVRLLLNESGAVRCEQYALAQGTPAASSDIVLACTVPVDPANAWLYHKTTHRPWYLPAMERIRAGACAEVLFVNTRGELTEGAISNIFIRRDGRLYTPPVSSGLLPGVLRKQLIRSGRCTEAVLRPGDLQTAEEILCGNSVRGLFTVRFAPGS
jgi:para-aminobenzoate synthetase/4-amino-4-deoxychorismate lyase